MFGGDDRIGAPVATATAPLTTTDDEGGVDFRDNRSLSKEADWGRRDNFDLLLPSVDEGERFCMGLL